jgi:hypothetical protein
MASGIVLISIEFLFKPICSEIAKQREKHTHRSRYGHENEECTSSPFSPLLFTPVERQFTRTQLGRYMTMFARISLRGSFNCLADIATFFACGESSCGKYWSWQQELLKHLP